MSAPLDARTTRLDAARRRGDDGRARRRRARRPLRRHGVRRRDPPPARAAPQRRPCRRAHDPRRRARRGRQRLRPRVPHASAAPSARSILVFTDLVDEAAARSLVDAVPVLAAPARGRRRVGARSRPRRRGRARRRRRRTTCTRPRSRSTCSTPAGAVVARLRHAGAEVVEAHAGRAGRSVRARLPAAQSAGASVAGVGSGAPRQNTRPQNSTPSPKPTISTTVETLARGREEAFDEAGDDEPEHRAEHDLDRGARLLAQRRHRGRDARDRRSPPRAASPRSPTTDDAAQLEHAVRERRARRTAGRCPRRSRAPRPRRAGCRCRSARRPCRARAGSRPRTRGT